MHCLKHSHASVVSTKYEIYLQKFITLEISSAGMKT